MPPGRGRPAGKRKSTDWWSLTRRPRASFTRARDDDVDEHDSDDDNTAYTACGLVPELKRLNALLPAAAPLTNVSDFDRICRNLIATSDYTDIFDAEVAANQMLCGEASALQPSRYRARLRGDAAIRYDARRRNQQRDQMAIQLHSNNQQHWSPSLIARSVAYFGKTSRFLRHNETKQRRIASKPTTLRAMHIMKYHRPRPEWQQGLHVECFAFDQTYQWVGVKKRGRRQAVERLDGAGMPIEVSHEVYINTIKVALPTHLGTLSQVRTCVPCMPHLHAHVATCMSTSTLVRLPDAPHAHARAENAYTHRTRTHTHSARRCTLTHSTPNCVQAALARIKANYGSAYTEPYNNILLPLQPSAVEQSLLDFAYEACALVDQACTTSMPVICAAHPCHLCHICHAFTSVHATSVLRLQPSATLTSHG